MAFIPAPNIVQVEVRALFDAQHIENVFDINAGGPVDAGLVDDITNVVSVWAQAEYFPLLPNQVTLVEVFGRDLTTSDGVQHTIAPEDPVSGGQPGIAMPNETSFCVSLRSGFSGRSARGRKYVLGLPQALVAGNNINSTLRGQLVDAFTALNTAITDGGWTWTIVSYRNGGIVRPGGPVYYPVTTVVSVDGTVDSQRRRKPGNGS